MKISNPNMLGASYVSIDASPTLQITGAACINAADIYVRLEEVSGSSANMAAPVNGIILPTNTSDSGTHGATCGGGTWDVNWATGNPVVIQP